MGSCAERGDTNVAGETWWMGWFTGALNFEPSIIYCAGSFSFEKNILGILFFFYLTDHGGTMSKATI